MGYRERCFEHHDRACWVCGEEEDPERERSNIEVHHIRGWRGGHGIDNLVPLCIQCHKLVHTETPREGDLRKLQAVLWANDRRYPKATNRATFVFEDGELQFRAVDPEE